MAISVRLICVYKTAADPAGMVNVGFRADYADTGNRQWSPDRTPNLTLQLTCPSTAASGYVAGQPYQLAIGASAKPAGGVSASLALTLT